LGETVLLDDELVQVVSEKVGTATAPVAVVDPEEGAFGPLLVLAGGWFQDVQDDRYSVLVVVPDYSLVGVCGIG
jgi:hypothetical protein